MKTKTKPVETDHAKENAQCQLASIVEMVKALETGSDDDQDKARERIQEDPLEVTVRSGWCVPGSKEYGTPEEFCILLSTGGPACRIIGQLSAHCEPTSAVIEYQDWGTPWTELRDENPDPDFSMREHLLAYCRQFYFGE